MSEDYIRSDKSKNFGSGWIKQKQVRNKTKRKEIG